MAGADDYLIKPVAKIKDAVRKIIFNRCTRNEENGSSMENSTFIFDRELSVSQINLIETYINADYPDLTGLANIMGLSAHVVGNRMKRIRARLGVNSNAQLAGLLTALFGYGARRGC